MGRFIIPAQAGGFGFVDRSDGTEWVMTTETVDDRDYFSLRRKPRRYKGPVYQAGFEPVIRLPEGGFIQIFVEDGRVCYTQARFETAVSVNRWNVPVTKRFGRPWRVYKMVEPEGFGLELGYQRGA